MEDFFSKVGILITTQGIPKSMLLTSVRDLCHEFGDDAHKEFFQTSVANLLRYQVILKNNGRLQK